MQRPRQHMSGPLPLRGRLPLRAGLRSGGMGPQFIFTMRDLRRFHPPDREVLSGINISMFPAAKIGVLGGNGAGKSSLLRIMAGEDDGYTGEARLTPGFTVGVLHQEPRLDPAKDVLGNVMDGVGEVAALLTRYDEVLAGWADPDADFEKLGGERRRVALCRLLLSRPDLLLLDEPTNHLDAESVAWLERFLQEYAGTVVAVTHDRYFLDNVAGWILELDRGRGIPFEGNYSSWLDQKQTRLAHEEKATTAQRRTLQHELEWIRQSPRARQAKSKARVAAYERLLNREAEGAPEPGRI